MKKKIDLWVHQSPTLKKLIMELKIAVLIAVTGISNVIATPTYSQVAKVSIDMENSTLERVMDEIERQSEFYFIFNQKQIDVNRVVDVKVDKELITDILPQLFDRTNVNFVILDKKILLTTEKLENSLTGAEDELQQQTVTGTVTDSQTGEPMPGVNILVRGTIIGTISDVSGRYSITLSSPNEILVFSFIGYNTLEQPVSGRIIVDVVLTPTTETLDEVIVIGYGTQKRGDLTGSVIRVSMEDRASLSNVNISQALSGNSAGVNVQASGLAGSEPDLSIRGRTSLSATDRPLIVLDGIIYNGSISDININDVETIDILKDASAAAVYGSRSANGVLLITTKRGKTDKPIISFNMYFGYQDMTNNPMKVMDAEQYATRLVDYYYQQDLYKWYKTMPTSDEGKPVGPDMTDRNLIAARLRTQEERDNFLAGNETNWVKEVFRLAPIHNYNLSFSGKSDKTNYFLSSSLTNEKGILKNDNFNRITLNSKIESKIAEWLTLGLIVTSSLRDYSGLEASLSDARTASPLANNKIGSPNFDKYLTSELYMPYPFNNLYIDHQDIRRSMFVVASGKITVPWVKGLTNEINYSNTYSNRNNNTFYPVTVPGGVANNGRAIKNPSEDIDWVVNDIVTYLRTFRDHQINVTLLYSQESRKGQTSGLEATGFDNATLSYNNMGFGTISTVNSSAWEENSLSYMARANYSFRNRYMLTVTVRKDGFSGFGPNKKFATFPSLSLGWVASEEPYFKNNDRFYLKLRTSFGKNGNQGIGRYSSFSRMAFDTYVRGATTTIAVYPNTLGNANLGWETTSSFNIGIDYGFLKKRVSGSIDIYKAETTNVLVNRALPPTTGYGSVWTNIGGIDNKGIELNLTTLNLKGRIDWETNFVFSLNRDKINTLYGDKSDKDIGNSWFVGESISAIYDYQMSDGLWTERELYNGNILDNWYPGQFKYIDQNGDGIIEPNADRTIIGYRNPNYRFSINNNITYKRFIFSFFINSIQGGNGYYLLDNHSVLNVDQDTDDVYRINASAVRPYWTPDNGVNNATGVYNTPMVHSGIYQSRSFVRLQDVSFSYRLGPNLLNKLKLLDCQFYIASKNPYVWTKWSGWDPETGTSNSPLMRNITMGVKIAM